jgi:hypothetical protein
LGGIDQTRISDFCLPYAYHEPQSTADFLLIHTILLISLVSAMGFEPMTS